MASLSSVMLNAGAGLLPLPDPTVGVALQVPPDLSSSTSGYAAIPIVNQFASVITAAANLMITTGTVSETQVIYGGSGYDGSDAPVPTFVPMPTGPYPAQASATVTISSSQVSSVSMISTGRGYSVTEPPSVLFLGGAGTGASASAKIKEQPGPLSSETFQSLVALGSTVFPALTDRVPAPLTTTDVYFDGTQETWQSGRVYDTGDIVAFVVLPEYRNTVTYLLGDRVKFSGGAYQATITSQARPPTDSDYWEPISVPPLYYIAVAKNQSQPPPGNAAWQPTSAPLGLATTVALDATTVMGSGDLTRFCQIFSSATAYISQTNSVIRGCNNSQILDQTFDPNLGGMTTLTTGALNQVSSDLAAFARDLSALGLLISLEHLDDLGLPGELLAQLGRVSGGAVPGLSDLLRAAGLTVNRVSDLARGENTLSATEEKIAYTAMLGVTGDLLQQVLLLLKVRTPSITDMARLLDPRMLFPTSNRSLLCPNVSGLEPVYLTNGSINTNLRLTLDNATVLAYSGPNNTTGLQTLELIIPADQALANKALARSLGQIKNIASAQLPALAAAAALVETNQGLTLVESQINTVPAVVTETYKQDLGSGSNPDGTIQLTDLVGVVTDLDIVDVLTQVATDIGVIDATALSAIFTRMQNLLTGVYGGAYGPITIPAGPGSGSYADVDTALQALISVADSEISTLAASYPDTAAASTAAWIGIAGSLQRQTVNLASAGIDFSELPGNNLPAAMSFASGLHAFAVDPETNDFLTTVANPNTLSGQSIVASLREGRNIAALQQAGIQLDTQIPDS
jgi:hypothetical protein